MAATALVAASGLLAGSASATHSPTDIDGDGWADVSDNCPRVYNERGNQHPQWDEDLDGVGDACDGSWWPNDGGTAWGLDMYFVDANQEPAMPMTCATLTITEVVHYGPPYNFDATNVSGPFNSCAANGETAMSSTSWRGSNVQSVSRTYEIDCAGGGVLSGSFPDAVATYIAVSPTCTQSPMHLYGGGPPGNYTPEAKMQAAPLNWRGPYTLGFYATGSFDPEGAPLTYSWDFGDGQSGSGIAPPHSYAATGTYTITVRAIDDTGTSGVKRETLIITGDRTKDFAPEVRLHPGENHFPMLPTTFIANSFLFWAHDAGCPDDVSANPPTASKLGGGGYKQREENDACSRIGPNYASNAYTRPYDGGSTGRAPIGNAEGFALNFNPSAEPASFSPMPVWLQLTGNAATYWFFYGRSVPRYLGFDLPAQREGDWEHANVDFDSNNVPLYVYFYAHGGGGDRYAYSAISHDNLIHPIVYSARGSHASYWDVGSARCGGANCLDDDTADGGPVWKTWLDVRSVTAQPWYGFGGAWGEVGQFGDTTGPLGPSPYKNPVG